MGHIRIQLVVQPDTGELSRTLAKWVECSFVPRNGETIAIGPGDDCLDAVVADVEWNELGGKMFASVIACHETNDVMFAQQYLSGLGWVAESELPLAAPAC